ncbi:hypothetical protein ACWPKS_15945 [Coraliomargarita sp. W4R72]
MPAPLPFQAAVSRLQGKSPVAATLNTEAWSHMPLDIRDASFFSAGVNNLSTLVSAQDILDEALNLNPEDAFADRSRFVADMRATLGSPEGDSRKLTDINSRRRLELIYDHQMEDAFSHGRWKAQQTPELLDAFPAQELIRVEDREERRDWTATWTAHGGTLYGGRMIAAIDDPIWTAISRFGHPWPPFDFGSGMGVQSISRPEAVSLGVISADAPAPQPPEQQFNADRKASLGKAPKSLADHLAAALAQSLQTHTVKKVTENGRTYLTMQAVSE